LAGSNPASCREKNTPTLEILRIWRDLIKWKKITNCVHGEILSKQPEEPA
jgi:hypothetical protein